MKNKEGSKCKVSKSLESFYPHKKNKDGLSYNCKECISVQRKSYHSKNKVRLSEYSKEYRNRNELINGYALATGQKQR